MGTKPLIDIAIFVLWSIICFTVGRMFGRADKFPEEEDKEIIESEPITVSCEALTAPHYEEKENEL